MSKYAILDAYQIAFFKDIKAVKSKQSITLT